MEQFDEWSAALEPEPGRVQITHEWISPGPIHVDRLRVVTTETESRVYFGRDSEWLLAGVSRLPDWSAAPPRSACAQVDSKRVVEVLESVYAEAKREHAKAQDVGGSYARNFEPMWLGYMRACEQIATALRLEVKHG